jgi:transitional endoplasmic reticulum ATPase
MQNRPDQPNVVMSDESEPALNPRVTEALARDLGKGLARLDPADIARLGLKVGDVVELTGKRRTVGRLMPTYSAYRGRGRIQIDGVTRENSGASVDQTVRVRPAVAKPAELVVLMPMTPPPSDSEMRALSRTLSGLPVLPGDRVRVGLVGQRSADFRVIRTTPGGPALIAPTTRLEVARHPSAELLSRDRPGGQAFACGDIGGLARVLARVREIVVLPLKFPEVFERLAVEPPRGVLLHGPPGCGKTLIARAVAHEIEAAFFTVNGPEVLRKHYGESEARLREVFDAATRQAPSVVFIDEVDALAPRREHAAGDVEKRVVAQLLALMDSLAQRPQVVVLAATSRPGALDPALRRPGRFDREIVIPVPDREARREILEAHRRGMPLAGDVDLGHLAAITHGFVGADLEALCREAAMACLRRHLAEIERDSAAVDPALLDRLEVTADDFQAALRLVEPSAIREVFVERPTVSWSDVGGLDEAKRRLVEALAWPLRHPATFARAGARPLRGVLLTGPPGCGKSLLARAAANETGVSLLAVQGPELLSKFAGDSERGVREVFHKARQAAPCVVFFDEVDALFPARGLADPDDRVGQRVLGQFLAEIDGVEGLEGVLVLGATSRPDRLDPALLRPGRFDLVLTIPLPDRAGRAAVARIALRDKPHADDVTPELIAARTEGCTGAEVQAVCARAALAAVREALASPAGDAPPDPRITRAHLDEALASVAAARVPAATVVR